MFDQGAFFTSWMQNNKIKKGFKLSTTLLKIWRGGFQHTFMQVDNLIQDLTRFIESALQFHYPWRIPKQLLFVSIQYTYYSHQYAYIIKNELKLLYVYSYTQVRISFISMHKQSHTISWWTISLYGQHTCSFFCGEFPTSKCRHMMLSCLYETDNYMDLTINNYQQTFLQIFFSILA